MNNRWYAEQFAKKNGFFWLPCPTCGEMFGGHEAIMAGDLAERLGKWSSINDPDYPPNSGHGIMICPACVVADKGEDTLGEWVWDFDGKGENE